MAAVVSVRDLRKRYRRRDPWAVDGVTFELQPGQAFGLLGPNGSGKTSVVKMIAGLLRPNEGKIALFGSEPGNPESRAQLGFAPEDPDFPKFLRASEVLDYFASLLGLDDGERKRRIPETLAFAGLDKERRQVRQFSKGMKQRLGIAQAILGRPKLLILDEPTADLDPLGRRDVRAIAAIGAALKIVSVTSPTVVSGGFGPPGSAQPDQALIDRLTELQFVSQLIDVIGFFALLIAFAIGMTAIYHDLESGAAVG